MRETVTALESALRELEAARSELPEDLGAELDAIIERARSVLAAIRSRGTAVEPAER
ncbi:MAG: hypothetical protein ACREQY_24675 [Candidatus Binatia bacterium]